MIAIVTGVAGFIGSNLAERLIRAGHSVIGTDNLSRKGANENLSRLRSVEGEFSFHQGDIRDDSFLRDLFGNFPDADSVFHLAGQVAVTSSMIDPRDDFGSNALGTFNVLEAVRTNNMNPVLLYASTNKVYGKLDDLKVRDTGQRYMYTDCPQGVSETRPLDFHSPYGCSKGTGDQYMIDYARIFGLRTVCFRQSCIYGINQFGVEDQGWVAWFTIAALLGKKISVYGNGKQVRDVLFIDDLIDAYLSAVAQASKTAGQVFNIGGGPENTLSILELIGYLENKLEKKIEISFEDWRAGDQKVFVADISKARTTFGWQPVVTVPLGVDKLATWTKENLGLIRRLLG